MSCRLLGLSLPPLSQVGRWVHFVLLLRVGRWAPFGTPPCVSHWGCLGKPFVYSHWVVFGKHCITQVLRSLCDIVAAIADLCNCTSDDTSH